MHRVLVMLAIGAMTAAVPSAAMAQTTTPSTPVVTPAQTYGVDTPPAYLQSPPYLQENAGGDGNGV